MKKERLQTALEIGAKLVLPDRPLRIKLLGDSITHGCGVPSFKEDGDLICSGYPERRNTKGYCWANLFAEYMRNTCGCEVVNNAICGTGIETAIDCFDELIDDEDDIVMIMYGANNRHEFFSAGTEPSRTREQFMRSYLSQVAILREKLEKAGKDYVFLSGPSDSLHSEMTVKRYDDTSGFVRHIHMWDIDTMLMKDSVENKYPFIPVYANMMRYFAYRGADPRDYREWVEPAGFVHLNEVGSRLVFRLVVEGLGHSLPPTI